MVYWLLKLLFMIQCISTFEITHETLEKFVSALLKVLLISLKLTCFLILVITVSTEFSLAIEGFIKTEGLFLLRDFYWFLQKQLLSALVVLSSLCNIFSSLANDFFINKLTREQWFHCCSKAFIFRYFLILVLVKTFFRFF